MYAISQGVVVLSNEGMIAWQLRINKPGGGGGLVLPIHMVISLYSLYNWSSSMKLYSVETGALSCDGNNIYIQQLSSSVTTPLTVDMSVHTNKTPFKDWLHTSKAKHITFD
jgi:hypothetical protein